MLITIFVIINHNILNFAYIHKILHIIKFEKLIVRRQLCKLKVVNIWTQKQIHI